MFVADATKNAMLAAFVADALYSGLGTAYSTTGGNELASVSYSRFSNTWGTPGSGAVALAATLPSWDCSNGDEVVWVNFYDAPSAGNFVGTTPFNGETIQPCSVEAGDLGGDTINCDAHGFAVDDRVVFWPGSDEAIPTGLTVGIVYFVLAVTTDTFTVALTSGGTVINVSTGPQGFFVQRCTPVSVVTNTSVELNSGTVDLAGLL